MENFLILQIGGNSIIKHFELKEEEIFSYYKNTLKDFSQICCGINWFYYDENGYKSFHRFSFDVINTNSVFFQSELKNIIDKSKKNKLEIPYSKIERKEVTFCVSMNNIKFV